jgi:hypothetical protein
VEFDHYTAALLVLRPDAPKLDEEAANALQDAHLSYLADLHEAGHLLAVGPLADPELRGLSIFDVDPERTRELTERDPAVIAGRFSVRVMPWMVPGGAVSFSRTRLPRSTAEAQS